MIDVRVTRDGNDGEDAEPVLRRQAELLYGLGNFIENAVDFAETTVVVDGRWNDHNLLIRIEDDGPGFSTEILSKIGEPYVTTRDKGTGLGLPIVKKIIEEHGGTLALLDAPQFEGNSHVGAMAEIRLPLMTDVATPPETPVAAQ